MRVAAVGLIVLLLGGLIATLDRSPVFSYDAQLYASIARSLEISGDGAPSMLRHSPWATDHIRFYGPVFFHTAAAVFRLLGISKWNVRIISFAGALLCAAAGAALARGLTGSRDRAAWAFTLLLLTPELEAGARSGTMHTLAIGFELAALAVFTCGLQARRQAWLYGLVSGALLIAAALTTPRTYLFIAAFCCAGLIAARARPIRRQAAVQLAVAVSVLAAVMGGWAVLSHGGVIKWLRFMAYIATHEDTDVALVSLHREWEGSLSRLFTPGFAILGAVLAALTIERTAGRRSDERTPERFAIATGWLTLVATVCAMNITLSVNDYSMLPLTAAVLAMPGWSLAEAARRWPVRAVALGMAVFVAGDLVVLTRTYVRIGATWSARDPTLVVEWLRALIEPDSEVVGPGINYFFVVERAGGHYRSESPRSWADWARWVPEIEPEVVGPLPHARPVSGRYYIMDATNVLPDEYQCAIPVDRAYEPPPPNFLIRLGWLAEGGTAPYPKTVLYQLPQHCPAGYDPTGFGQPIVIPR